MKKINIVQFLPYFPPHIWGVERVWEEIFLKWTYWKSFILSWNICQQSNVYKKKVDNNVIYFFPCIEIVDNFIFPSLWTKKFWIIWKDFTQDVKTTKGEIRVLTHTRFFLSSLMWAIFARRNQYKWIHLEHGSSYVKLSSSFTTQVAYIYDRCIWKTIFRKADKILAISNGSKNFIEKEFKVSWVETWYRGFNFPKKEKKYWELHFIFIGRLVHLKWVEDLLQAYKESWLNKKLIIIWDGEEKKILEKKFQDNVIYFLWQKSHDFIIQYLSQHNCILINPSYQEGLPTTVIEALATKNTVIATNVWWTSEISKELDLMLFEPWDKREMKRLFRKSLLSYEKDSWRSFSKVLEKFQWEKSIEDLYKKIQF